MKFNKVKLENVPQSVLIYGPPKSGKTLLAGKLAQDYKVIWLDLENGASTLFQLPEEAQENIEYFSIKDTKDEPQAINTVLRLITGAKTKICHAHGKTTCGTCAKLQKVDAGTEYFTEISLNALPTSDYIVVIDSFTQLCSSANAHAGRNLDLEKDQFTYDHWRHQGQMLEKFLDMCQNAEFNVVVITHEENVKVDDGTEKLIPSGGTQNFARKVPKYFGHIIHLFLTNKKHKSNSVTTGEIKAVAGSRTNIDVNLEDKNPLLSIFKSEIKPVKTATPIIKGTRFAKKG